MQTATSIHDNMGTQLSESYQSLLMKSVLRSGLVSQSGDGWSREVMRGRDVGREDMLSLRRDGRKERSGRTVEERKDDIQIS